MDEPDAVEEDVKDWHDFTLASDLERSLLKLSFKDTVEQVCTS